MPEVHTWSISEEHLEFRDLWKYICNEKTDIPTEMKSKTFKWQEQRQQSFSLTSSDNFCTKNGSSEMDW